jgi:hypothetical protein
MSSFDIFVFLFGSHLSLYQLNPSSQFSWLCRNPYLLVDDISVFYQMIFLHFIQSVCILATEFSGQQYTDNPFISLSWLFYLCQRILLFPSNWLVHLLSTDSCASFFENHNLDIPFWKSSSGGGRYFVTSETQREMSVAQSVDLSSEGAVSNSVGDVFSSEEFSYGNYLESSQFHHGSYR